MTLPGGYWTGPLNFTESRERYMMTIIDKSTMDKVLETIDQVMGDLPPIPKKMKGRKSKPIIRFICDNCRKEFSIKRKDLKYQEGGKIKVYEEPWCSKLCFLVSMAKEDAYTDFLNGKITGDEYMKRVGRAHLRLIK